jgi:hypothetical protein
MDIKKNVSQSPLEIEDIEYDSYVKEALRLSIIAEYDAINLYEQLADKVKDKKIKELFLDVAKEEKVHVGEFQRALDKLDSEQESSLEEGEEEADELLKELLFVPYDVKPPKGVTLKRHPQGGRYVDTDTLTEEQKKILQPKVNTPTHLWGRAGDRARFRSIKDTINDLNTKVLPRGDWWTPLQDNSGFLVGTNNTVKTVLSRDMLPKGTKI